MNNVVKLCDVNGEYHVFGIRSEQYLNICYLHSTRCSLFVGSFLKKTERIHEELALSKSIRVAWENFNLLCSKCVIDLVR